MSTAADPIRRDLPVSLRRPDGTLAILNFRFGDAAPPRPLLTAADAPPELLALGRDLVARHREATFRRALLAAAEVDGDAMRVRLLRDDLDLANERLTCAVAHYRAALALRDGWAVLAVDGHAVGRPDMARAVVEVVRLDGKTPCDSCRGCGRRRSGDGPEACPRCGGSGVSPVPAVVPWCVREAIEAHAPASVVEWAGLPAVPADAAPDPSYQRFIDSLRPSEF
jgi:hypothetical protein